LKTFDGKLLLHVEQDDGTLLPTWEHSTAEDVRTLKELMDEHTSEEAFKFVRIPMT
jgi:hypothetical protein